MADPGELWSKFLAGGQVTSGQVNLTLDLVPLFNEGRLQGSINVTDFSSGVTPSDPVNTVLPSITGTAQVGATLTGHVGTWTGNPAFTYTWTKDGTPIVDATQVTYVPVSGDATHLIRFVVTGTNRTGVPVVATSASVTIAAAPVTVPLANLAAMTAMFAAGVGASGGKTYLMSGTNSGNVELANIDFSSNPIVILGQSGTLMEYLTLDNVHGITWQEFNVQGVAPFSFGSNASIQCVNGTSHITFDGVSSVSNTGSAGVGNQVGAGFFIALNATFITVEHCEIRYRGQGIGISNATHFVIESNTIHDNGADGIVIAGVTDYVINANLGYDWWPDLSGPDPDHPDFIQGFNTIYSINARGQITNNGFQINNGLGSQGIFLGDGTQDDTVVQNNWIYTQTFKNGVACYSGANIVVDNNFAQGDAGGNADVEIGGSHPGTFTNNQANGFDILGDNPGLIQDNNVAIVPWTAGDFTQLDAFLAATPTARARL